MSTYQQNPTPVRMPSELKEWVKAMAAAEHRSVNAEIVMLLTRAKEEGERKVMKD